MFGRFFLPLVMRSRISGDGLNAVLFDYGQ
jgi:hypothetical protein